MTDAARAFRGFRFPAEVILCAVRWYLQFPISYRDLERILANRGVEVDHTTMYRWVQHFAPELEKRMRRHLRPCRGLWYVDETYIRVSGQWRYLYRAVDGTGQTIDFLLSAKRDKKTAKRFFKRALGREHTRNQPSGSRLADPVRDGAHQAVHQAEHRLHAEADEECERAEGEGHTLQLDRLAGGPDHAQEPAQ